MKINRILLFISIILLSASVSFAGKPKKVKILFSSTYNCSNDDSKNEGRRKAIEQAKIDALSDRFGVVMNEHNIYDITEDNEQLNSHFISSTTSNVKGEWVTMPKITCTSSYDNHLECFVFHITVEGIAREILTADVGIHSSVLLRPDDSPERECLDIQSEQYFYLYFNSPVSGYLIAYVINEYGKAQRILPYFSDSRSNVRIEGGRDYVFFEEDNCVEGYEHTTNNMYLYTNDSMVSNRMVILFSENPIHKAHDVNPSLIPKYVFSLPISNLQFLFALLCTTNFSLSLFF